MKIIASLFAALAVFALSGAPAPAADKGTKPEAIALVKKAVDTIKANGPEKAYAQFGKADGGFRDRDLYVLVYDMTGTCLAHGINPKLVGKNNLEAQDADGVYYVKDRLAMAKTKDSFWQDYKYTDPVTKKIEPKSTYCEKLNQTVVCVGIYK
jgi:signal transduction histidine kinase